MNTVVLYRIKCKYYFRSKYKLAKLLFLTFKEYDLQNSLLFYFEFEMKVIETLHTNYFHPLNIVVTYL